MRLAEVAASDKQALQARYLTLNPHRAREEHERRQQGIESGSSGNRVG